MAPTSSSSLSIGTQTRVRAPVWLTNLRRWGSDRYAGSSAASRICTDCFVLATRGSALLPVTLNFQKRGWHIVPGGQAVIITLEDIQRAEISGTNAHCVR